MAFRVLLGVGSLALIAGFLLTLLVTPTPFIEGLALALKLGGTVLAILALIIGWRTAQRDQSKS